jgi:hypothetical protein
MRLTALTGLGWNEANGATSRAGWLVGSKDAHLAYALATAPATDRRRLAMKQSRVKRPGSSTHEPPGRADLFDTVLGVSAPPRPGRSRASPQRAAAGCALDPAASPRTEMAPTNMVVALNDVLH